MSDEERRTYGLRFAGKPAEGLIMLRAEVRGDQLTLTKSWVSDEVGWTDQPGDVRILPWG